MRFGTIGKISKTGKTYSDSETLRQFRRIHKMGPSLHGKLNQSAVDQHVRSSSMYIQGLAFFLYNLDVFNTVKFTSALVTFCKVRGLQRKSYRSSRPKVFYKERVLKKFAKFTGKHLSVFL